MLIYKLIKKIGIKLDGDVFVEKGSKKGGFQKKEMSRGMEKV